MNDRVLEHLHDRWLDPPESKIAFYCDQCGGEVYVGEGYLECDNGDCIHEDCKDDWIKKNVTFITHTAG